MSYFFQKFESKRTRELAISIKIDQIEYFGVSCKSNTMFVSVRRIQSYLIRADLGSKYIKIDFMAGVHKKNIGDSGVRFNSNVPNCRNSKRFELICVVFGHLKTTKIPTLFISCHSTLHSN